MTARYEVYSVEVFAGVDEPLRWIDEWRWRLVAGNGEIVAHGEGYTRREDAARAVERIRELAASATVEVRE